MEVDRMNESELRETVRESLQGMLDYAKSRLDPDLWGPEDLPEEREEEFWDLFFEATAEWRLPGE
jgi:hypothetical protein